MDAHAHHVISHCRQRKSQVFVRRFMNATIFRHQIVDETISDLQNSHSAGSNILTLKL